MSAHTNSFVNKTFLAIALCLAALLVGALHCISASDGDVGWAGETGGMGYDSAAGGDANEACREDEVRCDGVVAWRCDHAGNKVDHIDCGIEGKVCVASLGCVACEPGATKCSDGIGSYCLDDASGVETFECDPLLGLHCEPDGCVGACTPQKLGRTHVGCDFWPTVTANSVWSNWFSFGVLVVNTTDEAATLTVTRGDETVFSGTLDAEGVSVIELPWVDELKGPQADNSGYVIPPIASVFSEAANGGGSYRLRSDRPVVVTQFNTLRASESAGVGEGCPIDSGSSECLSRSNDASLLLPSSSFGVAHMIMGWKSWLLESGGSVGDFLSVTAAEDETTVTVVPSSAVRGFETGDGTADGIEAGEARQFTLQRGDVLQLLCDASSPGAQLAGSEVTATRPVQILTGSCCANIPIDVGTCDHIEETNLPLSMLGRRYLVAALSNPDGQMRHVVRVHGVEDETVIAFDPPSVHKPVSIDRGETVTLDLPLDGDAAQDFVVSSSSVFGVTQYMVGHRAGQQSSDTPTSPPSPTPPTAAMGDPSQTFVVPVSRYVKRYYIAVPPGFEDHRVDVVAPTGSDVMWDDVPIPSGEFRAVGASGLSVARLTGVESGRRHVLRSDSAFGVQVYGFGKYTSWMVPGGLETRLYSQ